MRILKHLGMLSTLLIFMGVAISDTRAEQTGTLRGIVKVKDRGTPLQGASVQILPLGRSTDTGEQGNYEFLNVPSGTYTIISHMHALADVAQTVEIQAGQETTLDLEMSFEHLHHEVVVTASGREQTSFESFQAVSVLDSLELGSKAAFGLGELTDRLPGVNKRSFGPGSARPVVRGFDGDRVLVLSDGLPTGTLSAQSGEHAEPIDSMNLDRLEIVKGPATLLYGSNAIGGVVNSITEHHLVHEHPHEGIRANLHADGGSNNNQASGGATFELGKKNWLFWGGGNRQVAGDYSSPEGRVENSKTRLTSGHVGLGWYGKRPFFTLGYSFNDGRFGVPFAGEFHHPHESGEDRKNHPAILPPLGADGNPNEDHALVDEDFTSQNIRFGAGALDLGAFVEKIRFTANYTRWMHRELENEVAATSFDNKQFNLRGVFEQAKTGRLTGQFGFQTLARDYAAAGEEALTPPVTTGSFALFALEELDLEKARLQFGGRVEHTHHNPEGFAEKSFTGFSGAAGMHVPLWKHGAFVANYTHSFRAPALEELYNNGPHIGNLTYEIGNPLLKRERSNGVDLSLRHDDGKVHTEFNFFAYHLSDFIYLALTGEVQDGLREARYAQADARFVGSEASFDVALHQNLWLNLGMDAVRAELTESHDPLPRIPPLRGRFGFDLRYQGFSLKPELILADDQSRIYPTETRTPGYAAINLDASYILPTANSAHVFSVRVFNIGNRLYRNHLSFIKDLAPEMGRGVRFSYNLRLF